MTGSTEQLGSLAVDAMCPSLLVSGNPLVVCLDVGPFDGGPSNHVRPLLAIEFSGVRRVSVIERFAVNILGVFGQIFSDTRW